MKKKRIATAMEMQARPEPMNAMPFHPKVKVSLTLSDPTFVAGNVISGKMEMECKADAGLGIGIMMVELFATQELTSRDHSATSIFLHSQRLFQGPGLPPSNAVLPHPIPGELPLPQHYHQARRGHTTFFFRLPTPITSPSTIDFGNGLACVQYEVKCTVGVAWRGERILVTDKKSVDVVESYEEDDFSRIEPEGIVVGANGKIWAQGRVTGGLVVAGESACVELQVKNHSSKRTTGLQISLTRSLHLGNVPTLEKASLQITDTLTTVAFRGPDYIMQPGAEGVASLVFDVPRNARSVKGGPRDGDGQQGAVTDCLFEVRCTLGIKIGLPLGSKDILLDLPVTIVHPLAVPQVPVTPERFTSPNLYGSPPHTSPPLVTPPRPYLDRVPSPSAYAAPPVSPIQQQYSNHTGQEPMWLPNPHPRVLNPCQYFSPPRVGQEYFFLPPPQPYYDPHPRPSSTEPRASQALHGLSSAMPDGMDQHLMLPLDAAPERPVTPEEGKGERASRISNNLRMSSRNRSVSPQSHRFPLPAANAVLVPGTVTRKLPQPPPSQGSSHLNLANLSPGGESVVHSPHPIPSPKHSFTIDLITHNTIPKSERVEELERMTEEVEYQKEYMSDDMPKSASTSIIKIFPSPPISPNRLSPPAGTNRPTVDAVFATNTRQASLASVDEAPPTPMLTAVTPVRFPRPDAVLGATLGQGKHESGLDALERRLLAEVGTRKVDKDDRHADVRTVLPIAIPSPAVEPLNDSAISSLTLADHEHDHDHDSDEGTHHPGKHSPSEDDRDIAARQRKATRGEGSGQGKEKAKDGERRAGKKKEKVNSEVHKRRRSAKGRVAAWLGGIDPEIPPPMDASPLLLPSVAASAPGDDMEAVATDLREDTRKDSAAATAEPNASSPPNPRSSGFVPIRSLKRDEERRQSGISERVHAYKGTDLATKEVASPLALSFTREPQSPKIDRLGSPPLGSLNIVGKKPMQPSSSSIKDPERIYSKDSPRLPAYPPTPDPEAKDNIRSARGGGSRVAAVASIWASQTGDNVTTAAHKVHNRIQTKPVAKPAKPPSPASLDPPLADLTARRARLIKSRSVPAAISSSHATPMLSTTASLSRSSPLPDRRKTPIKLPPTVSESLPEISQPVPRSTTMSHSTGGDLAFGQARLRDLIKKYQGQATS